MHGIEKHVISLWVDKTQDEQSAPDTRIVHSVFFTMACRPKKARIGFKQGEGYFKCGSSGHIDQIFKAVVYAYENMQWIWCATYESNGVLEQDAVDWIPVSPAHAYRVELRASKVDLWWPCWNIADTGVVVDAVGVDVPLRQPARSMHSCSPTLDAADGLIPGVVCNRTPSFVQYTSAQYTVGFRLKRSGMRLLVLHMDTMRSTRENLLAQGSLLVHKDDLDRVQGPVLQRVGEPPVCSFSTYDVLGTTEVSSSAVAYKTQYQDLGVRDVVRYEVHPDKLIIELQREVSQTLQLLESAMVRFPFDATVSPVVLLGSVVREGRTGCTRMPGIIHWPGYGSVSLNVTGPVVCRFQAVRPKHINVIDISLGEKAALDGCYFLERGVYSGRIECTFVSDVGFVFRDDVPIHMQRVLSRYAHAGLPFRADIASYSNNGNSMGAPICSDSWAVLSASIPAVSGLVPMEYMRCTIEKHLAGAPAYGAGIHPDGTHRYEDEYIMTDTAFLLGIALFLQAMGESGRQWYERNKHAVQCKVRELATRDVDGDALLESEYRHGVSGDSQWSTCWYDVISYGYKDAFSNALLYGALQVLDPMVCSYGDTELGNQLANWAERLKLQYQEIFMTGHGWFAGWKSSDGKLHDHAFLAVNGAAVSWGLLTGNAARNCIQSLYNALISSGFDSFDLGLPGNVFPIPNDDMAVIQHVLPFGGYQNGGVTLSQARHFVNAMYQVGMVKEADMILESMCEGLLNSSVVGGVGSGCDWMTWDGVCSGYEGFLSDQMAILEPMIQRYTISKTSSVKV